MHETKGIIGACQEMRRHAFLKALNRHFDDVGHVPGAVLHFVYEDFENPDAFPSISVTYEHEDAEALAIGNQAQALFSLADALCDNLIKAAIALDEIQRISPDTYMDIRRLDYHIENFYMRVPIALEHVFAISACVFSIPDWERSPVWKLKKAVATKSQVIAGAIQPLEDLVQEVRPSRNEVAHTGEYSDDRLSGIRAHLPTSEMIFPEEFREHAPQLHRSLVRFQKEFVAEGEARLLRVKAALDDVLSVISGEAAPILEAAETAMRAAWARAPEDPSDRPDSLG